MFAKKLAGLESLKEWKAHLRDIAEKLAQD